MFKPEFEFEIKHKSFKENKKNFDFNFRLTCELISKIIEIFFSF